MAKQTLTEDNGNITSLFSLQCQRSVSNNQNIINAVTHSLLMSAHLHARQVAASNKRMLIQL